MADVYKVLGQSAPVAATLTTLYTVPASTSTIVSTLVVANRGATSATYRISVAIGGAADAPQQYIAYDATIGANETVALTLGMTLAQTDVIRVYSSSGNLTFVAFGVEKI